MRAVSVTVLAVMVVAMAGTARAQDDYAKKIVGMWEATKSASGDLPAGTIIEFTKDFKIAAVIKQSDGDVKIEGTYKIEKDKIPFKVKIGETTIEDTATIKKLTDDALELEDKDKKIDVFKRKR